MAYFTTHRTTLAAWALMLICTAAGAVGVPLDRVLVERCRMGSDGAVHTTASTTQGAWSQSQQTTISDTTNRLISIATTSQLGTQTPVSTTTSPSYNSAGDPSTDGILATTYDGKRRIDSIIKTGANQARTYYATNALGQRVFKTEPLFGTPTADAKKLGWAYVYDEDGTLLGEYGMGGAASSGSTEHIYLPTPNGPLPVATIINGQHYAVHADHLNTPRRITAANNQVVWQWAYSAFGETEPTTADKRFTSMATKPSTITTNTGIQAVTYNLRYPGQVFDQESGLHYNYFRTYDPKTGRYTQPDPIGLEGGWNRYSYVDGNPLTYKDLKGLSPEDVKKIQEAIADCITQLTNAGKRSTNGYINNYLPGTEDCGQQTESVIECLKKKNLELDDMWEYYLRAGFGHAWMSGVSSNPSDAPIYFDPKWNNFSQGEPCSSCSGWGGSATDALLDMPVGVPLRPQPAKPKPSTGGKPVLKVDFLEDLF